MAIVWDFETNMLRIGPFNDKNVGEHLIVINFHDSLGQAKTFLRILLLEPSPDEKKTSS